MSRCIFLDRDGTINKEVNYLHKIEEFEILPSVIEGLQALQDKGFLLIIVSNQSGIARGYFTEEDLNVLNRNILSILREKGIIINDVLCCPHLEDGIVPEYTKVCNCRKPKPGLLYRAQQKYNINLASSYMIGDKLSDIETGKNAGCSTILVRTGYGMIEEQKENNHSDFIADNLIDAARWIIRNEEEIVEEGYRECYFR